MEFENLLKLINTVSDSKLSGFKYEENGVKINLKKECGKVFVTNSDGVSAPNENANMYLSNVNEASINENEDKKEELSFNIVKSPLVGTFYSAPSEDAKNYVNVGDTVKKGQTLAIVEAMKLMNEIESEFAGKIAEIYVENGQAVEYGQPLFKIL